jgi:dTDP-4-dehydrorhamnose reductase
MMGGSKKVYIAGAGGMLGEAFHRVFGPNHDLKCSDIDLNTHWLNYLDFSSLEYCEEQPDDAYATNTLSVEYAVHIANELQIPLLYISTAGIFDGAQDVYDDWDRPNPLGHYARSKYMGEKFVAE